ncbi:MAG: hypothetical protein ACW99G_19085 [Candidatus Thorarchaeota archaeon]|jgi:hypothetical protein
MVRLEGLPYPGENEFIFPSSNLTDGISWKRSYFKSWESLVMLFAQGKPFVNSLKRHPHGTICINDLYPDWDRSGPDAGQELVYAVPNTREHFGGSAISVPVRHLLIGSTLNGLYIDHLPRLSDIRSNRWLAYRETVNI